MTFFGTILAAVLVLLEHFFYLLYVKRRTGLPFWKIVKAEFRAYINFNNASKPNLEVLKEIPESENRSDNGDTSKNSDNNDDKEEKKTKSKSASKTRSFARSRSRSVSVPKKKSSKSSGRKSPVPYGFIVPSSLESLKNDLSV